MTKAEIQALPTNELQRLEKYTDNFKIYQWVVEELNRRGAVGLPR